MATQAPTPAPDRFLRVLRKAHASSGLSLRALAAKSDTSPSYLSLLLNGQRGLPEDAILSRLERVLNVPNGTLFDAASVADATTKKFLAKEKARLLMRTLGPLNDEEMAQVLKLAEDLARKHRP